MALLLSDGRVHRPYSWVVSLASADGGNGEVPLLRLVEWPSQALFVADVAAGNMDDGVFVGVEVPGFSSANCGDVSAIQTALLALPAYAGAQAIS